VVGLSRDPAAGRLLNQLGAAHAVGDLFNREDLTAAVRAARPDVVIHAAKTLPKNGPVYFTQMRGTNRLHAEGTQNLLSAALAAGAAHFLVESIVFAYGYGDFGDTTITEDYPTRSRLPRRKLEPLVDGVLAMEDTCLNAQRDHLLNATVLRCGLFYGPQAGTDRMAQMMRRRLMPLPSGGRAQWPVVYIDDVADAFTLAVSDGTSGIFNIVDDQPVTLRDFTAEIARLAAVPKPWPMPRALSKAAAPYFTEVACTSMRVSNERAKAGLGWQLTHPTYREGLAAWARVTGRR
jgi:nucleoside-diphosphate-sugar epimerase